MVENIQPEQSQAGGDSAISNASALESPVWMSVNPASAAFNDTFNRASQGSLSDAAKHLPSIELVDSKNSGTGTGQAAGDQLSASSGNSTNTEMTKPSRAGGDSPGTRPRGGGGGGGDGGGGCGGGGGGGGDNKAAADRPSNCPGEMIVDGRPEGHRMQIKAERNPDGIKDGQDKEEISELAKALANGHSTNTLEKTGTDNPGIPKQERPKPADPEKDSGPANKNGNKTDADRGRQMEVILKSGSGGGGGAGGDGRSGSGGGGNRSSGEGGGGGSGDSAMRAGADQANRQQLASARMSALRASRARR